MMIKKKYIASLLILELKHWRFFIGVGFFRKLLSFLLKGNEKSNWRK